MKGNALDFSFSGLKTAVLRWVQQRSLDEEIAARRALLAREHSPTLEQWLAHTPRHTLDLLASFQHTVIQELLGHVRLSAAEIGANAVIVAGGVAANEGLRRAAALEQESGSALAFHFSRRELSTDNAAMIAAAASGKLERREFAGFDLKAQAALALTC
jgi:N6-L-threonylcarbamoyladenine synthase